MDRELAHRVADDPNYQMLVRERSRFGWKLAIAMLIVYYGFILLVAFDKELLAAPLGRGVMTLGMPVGFGIIVFTIAITAFYIHRANTRFDEMAEAIIREATK